MKTDKKNTEREIVIRDLEKRLLKKWEIEGHHKQSPLLNEKPPYLKVADITKLTKQQ
jgi:hypothetical protein